LREDDEESQINWGRPDFSEDHAKHHLKEYIPRL
jgi:hypothetical protein